MSKKKDYNSRKSSKVRWLDLMSALCWEGESNWRNATSEQQLESIPACRAWVSKRLDLLFAYSSEYYAAFYDFFFSMSLPTPHRPHYYREKDIAIAFIAGLYMEHVMASVENSQWIP